MHDTNSGFPRLSGDFNRGYTKAIQDIMEVFGYINNEFSGRKMFREMTEEYYNFFQ